MDYNLQATEDLNHFKQTEDRIDRVLQSPKKMHVWVQQTVAFMILITYHSN